ncbi:MAG: methyltransferase domain-containing protein [Geobacter sp.]|nr:methyltransferase domain-containing protein [Geobacter sp.]
MQSYVHGYHERESERLEDQARTLEELLHHDTRYPAGCHVLEAGCGVGAQTVILGRNSPEARFTSVDISVDSLGEARLAAARAGLDNVDFRQADLYALPFGDGTFDHVFLCFVLEHLHRPAEALAELRRVVKPGGTVTVIEGDHGTVCFHPESAAARRTIECLVELQELAGGDALIGRRLYPLLENAGLRQVRVSPRMVYADASRPVLVEGFTRKTFIAMVEGVRERAIAAAMMRDEAWERGIADLQRAADDDGTFCYTFFKGVGSR